MAQSIAHQIRNNSSLSLLLLFFYCKLIFFLEPNSRYSKLVLFNFYYCRVSEMLDYTADDLTGRSMYSLCHGSDVDKIRQTHTDRKFLSSHKCTYSERSRQRLRTVRLYTHIFPRHRRISSTAHPSVYFPSLIEFYATLSIFPTRITFFAA